MNRFRVCALLISVSFAAAIPAAFASTAPTSTTATGTRTGTTVTKSRRVHHASPAVAHPALAQVSHKITPVVATPGAAPVIRGGPWISPTFADSTDGDNVDGEDLVVRRAAADSLGPYNGSVVVVDPFTGRILSMVNQRVALGDGFQPCSTVKVSVALAALSEKVIQPASKFRLGGASRLDLTYALAHSINMYFATLGERMGFEKFSYYAHLFGYGEKAGLNVAGERPGRFPSGPPKNGGVGMLTSFGEEIEQTPLQLAALMSAIANGGTLYYLQYPRTEAEADHFVPQIKRRLEIGKWIADILPGMRGAVEFGTAHRAREDGPIAGKTGTCSSEDHVHLGWFGSFNDSTGRKLVVVVLLTGGRQTSGPLAAGIAGEVYRRLDEARYLGTSSGRFTPASLVTSQICCAK